MEWDLQVTFPIWYCWSNGRYFYGYANLRIDSGDHTKIATPHHIGNNLVTDMIDHTDLNESINPIIDHAGFDNNKS